MFRRERQVDVAYADTTAAEAKIKNLRLAVDWFLSVADRDHSQAEFQNALDALRAARADTTLEIVREDGDTEELARFGYGRLRVKGAAA